MVNIGNDWDEILAEEFQKDYYLKLREFLKSEYSSQVIYPPMFDIFNALKYTAYKDVKVVIIGQDPYHGEGQAHGLCFSVKRGVRIPPSLVNIFKELDEDMYENPWAFKTGGEQKEFRFPQHGCLTSWAEQGVLLLNTVLTVRAGKPQSHKGQGWETFTDCIISKLNERERPMAFVLWGANAKAKEELITNKKHLILKGAHPSPFSAYNGFFGGRYFSRINDFLRVRDMEPVDWQLPE